MDIFSIKRHFRRRWKRWRRAIWTISACGLVALMAWCGLLLSKQMESLMAKEPLVKETLGMFMEVSSPSDGHKDWLNGVLRDNHPVIVHLNKVYTCGEESEVLGLMKPEELSSLMKDHPDWEGHVGAGGDVWLSQKINDLSQACRQEGYIGIDIQGNLSLFKGPPKKEKVIKTFFQLDVEMMESALPDDVLRQLKEGIRVQDVDEYNSVISTFSDYAVEQSEEVMQQNGL